MSDINKYDIVTGVFNPKILKTLKPEVKKYIGRKMKFEAMYILEDVDTSVYAGQWCLMVRTEEGEKLDFVWVPEQDVDVIDIVNLKIRTNHDRTTHT